MGQSWRRFSNFLQKVGKSGCENEGARSSVGVKRTSVRVQRSSVWVRRLSQGASLRVRHSSISVLYCVAQLGCGVAQLVVR